MQGDEKIDNLMLPALRALDRHVKDRDAKTEIYNRAYEALMEVMDALDVSAKVTAKQIAENAKNLQRAEAAEKRADILEDKCATLEKDLTEVCRLRLEAADSFSKQIIDLENKVRELEAAARWIPVGERLPGNDGVHCDLVLMYMDDHNIREGYYDDGNWYFTLLASPITRTVTHWMPLPQPPESEVTHDRR